MTFEKSLEEMMGVVKQWNSEKNVTEVTVIRDVLGRCSLILGARQHIEAAKLDALRAAARAKLGSYYRDVIYCKNDANNDLVKGMIKIADAQRLDYSTEEGVQWYVLERAIAKKAWVNCNYKEDAIWPYSEAIAGKKPKVVTFYSFKGGMGRTTALAAAAIGLAQRGKNVLIIDTDVEAPGLASLFIPESEVDYGIVDYLLEGKISGDQYDMAKGLRQISDPILMNGLMGKLFVIPAGKIDSDYLQKLARIDYQDTIPGNMKRQICAIMDQAISAISGMCQVDYILLDSRAGFHDMGGVVTTQIPHGVVCFGKESKQSWQGVNLVIRAIASSQREKPFVAIVDSAWEQSGVVSTDAKQIFKKEAYEICCNSYYDGEFQPGLEADGEVHSPIFVPFYPVLSKNIALYSDGSEVANEAVQQIKSIMQQENYQEITNRIESWFGSDEGGAGNE